MPVTGLNGPNTGKEDDGDDEEICFTDLSKSNESDQYLHAHSMQPR
jgi:hypothetical protein